MDALESVLRSFYEFMESGPGIIWGIVALVVGSIPVILLHEAGHAAMARYRLGGSVEIEVGTSVRVLKVSFWNVTASINLLSDPRRGAGQARVDVSSATARDVMLIALAGPAASLAGVLAAIGLYSVAPDEGVLHTLAWASTVTGVFGVLNLIPYRFQERRSGPVERSDGRMALDAFRISRAID